MDGTARQGPAPSINQQVRSPHRPAAPAAVDGATARGQSTRAALPDAPVRRARRPVLPLPAPGGWFPAAPVTSPLGAPRIGRSVPPRRPRAGSPMVQGRRKSGPGPSHFRGKNRQKPECETGCGTDRAIQFRRRSIKTPYTGVGSERLGFQIPKYDGLKTLCR